MISKNISGNKNQVSTNKKALKFSLKIFVIVLLLCLIGGGLWLILKTYNGKIYPRITIAGQNVGGLTPSEAKNVVQGYVDKLNAQGPELEYSDKVFNTKLSEMGINFDTQKVVDDAYSFGRRGNFVVKIREAYSIARGTDISLAPQIDEAKLDEYLSKMATVVEVSPIDASLKFENDQFQLNAGSNGVGLDKKKLKNDLAELIKNGKTQGKIIVVTSVLEPTIKETGTLEAKAQAEKYLQAAPITLAFENETFVANRSNIGSWIAFVKEGNKLKAEISQSEVSAFVAQIAKKIEIAKVDREIVDGTGEVRNEGRDGRGVDTNSLSSEIRSRLAKYNHGDTIAISTFAISKGEVTFYPSALPGRFPGKYIDINISEQTLRAFEGKNLVKEFLISSGTYSHPTPLGQFSVYGKSRVTRMDGPDYDLPGVEWVSWWSGDYSIHGTYWHSNFGNRMSHGCVNASNSDAEWIYNWDEIGTPVYVHD